MKKTLTEWSVEHGTDKGPSFHNYMPMYETWLAKRKIKKLLEVGLLRGQSARMWRDYFTDADIYMMDNFSQPCPGFDFSGTTIIEGDSTRKETWTRAPDDLDVIVDDGSHQPNDQIATFMHGFIHLKRGGLYFIEDTYYNFNKEYTGSNEDIIYSWFSKMIANQSNPDWWGNQVYPRDVIYSYHFYKSVIMIEKAL